MGRDFLYPYGLHLAGVLRGGKEGGEKKRKKDSDYHFLLAGWNC